MSLGGYEVGLDVGIIISHRVKQIFFVCSDARRGRRKPMKHVVRISILMCGLVGTYVAAAVPQVPAPDGGPIFVCPPQQQLQGRCVPLPPMSK